MNTTSRTDPILVDEKVLRNRRYYREWYERHAEEKKILVEKYRKENWGKIKQQTYARIKKAPEKQKARDQIKYAIKTGKLSELPCAECGNFKVDFHHTNGYDKDNWFRGMWLCRKHHANLHKEIRCNARQS